MEMK